MAEDKREKNEVMYRTILVAHHLLMQSCYVPTLVDAADKQPQGNLLFFSLFFSHCVVVYIIFRTTTEEKRGIIVLLAVWSFFFFFTVPSSWPDYYYYYRWRPPPQSNRHIQDCVVRTTFYCTPANWYRELILVSQTTNI